MDTMHSGMRKYARADINSLGKIIRLNGLRLAKNISCTVINISEGGALIHADAPVSDPEFYLELNSEPSRLRLCSLVRRLHGNYIGVQFITSVGKYK